MTVNLVASLLSFQLKFLSIACISCLADSSSHVREVNARKNHTVARHCL